MATTKTAIAPRNIGSMALPEAPGFMEADQQMGAELIQTKVRLPFLKLIQKQSSDQMTTDFGVGSAVLLPGGIVVLEWDGPAVRIIPLFFYLEWCKWSPLQMRDSEPMIMERSLDPTSELARRANNPKLRFEQYKDTDLKCRYVEHLNFLCLFQEEHLQIGMPFTLGFSRGEHGTGQRFCNLISMRKRPPFGCVFDLAVDPNIRKNAKGEWRGFKIENPSERPWVDNQDEYTLLKSEHERLKELHEKRELETQYDQDEEEGTQTGGF